MSPGARGFVCPACRSPVQERHGGFACTSCSHIYPVLFGIPDFRLLGDQYLSLDDERAKAGRLHEFGETRSLKDLVSFYYSITDDVPAHLEPVFTEYVL